MSTKAVSPGDAVEDELTIAIVSAVADAKGVEPLELEQRLYDVVDPEALAKVFAPDSELTGQVEFELDGVRVRVTDGPDVTVV